MVRLSDFLLRQTTPGFGALVFAAPSGRTSIESNSAAPLASPHGVYTALLEECNQVLEQVRQLEPLSIRHLMDLTARLVRLLPDQPDAFRHLALDTKCSFSLASHGVNVAILTVHLGLELGIRNDRLEAMALAGLLNDIGMATLADVAQTPSLLGPWQLTRIREHPWLAERILARCADVPDSVREFVLHEHERVDGSGYPQRLAGEKISEDAQLIGLIDVYEALTHDRPHRKALLSSEALRSILQDHRSAFGRQLLRGLLEIVPIYPVGSWVELNGGRLAKVVDADKRRRLSPTICILTDEKGALLAHPQTVSLAHDTRLHIVRSIPEPSPTN